LSRKKCALQFYKMRNMGRVPFLMWLGILKAIGALESKPNQLALGLPPVHADQSSVEVCTMPPIVGDEGMRDGVALAMLGEGGTDGEGDHIFHWVRRSLATVVNLAPTLTESLGSGVGLVRGLALRNPLDS
jgi:hypothetical protein